MNLLELIGHHGYLVTSIVVFSACCGLPLPLSVVLLAAGAAAHGGSLNLAMVILCAWSAALAGDMLMYLGGRYTGWWLLTNICKFSMNQEACVFGSAHQFYKRGPRALVIAKFVPGLAEVSSVLAGSLSMRPRRFLMLDGLGILLYVTSWSVAGFVFARFLREAIGWVERVGHLTAAMLGGIVVLYVLWVVLSLLRESRLPKVEKIAAKDLRKHLQTAKNDRLLIIADVRSRGYYDPGMQRIKNSIRVDPGRIREDLEVLQEFMLPQPDCEIYLYCSCAHEATSMRVARMLQRENCTTKVIRGGLKAWVKAGGPVEPVPHDDVEHLPRFE
ncbi:MAG: VTT domain-containing protein [Acidobacteriaceae bacterium]|jgi:membrane protein DedA with SNARE-associated domain/rhodanese-related sulfurtransferase